MGMVLAQRLPEHQHFIPIEAEALAQYRIFEKLGFFGIEPGTTKGARDFLRTCRQILAQPKTALWITAQGQFTDPRQRPVKLMSGVGHLARRLDNAIILPLALEYPFWNERYPEALARFGEPIHVYEGKSRSVEEWMQTIEGGLTVALDALAQEACQRKAELFENLIEGSVGIGGIYDLWRRFKSLLTGKRFNAAHEAQG